MFPLLVCPVGLQLGARGFYFPSHSEWSSVVRGPSADVHSFKAAALEMPISSAAQRRSFPFSVLLLSSSIVSLWGSLFRGIHASAFRPQWPPLYKLSACLPQAFGSYCFLFFNKLGGVHQLLQCSHKITDGPPSPFHFFFLLFFLLAAVCVSERRHSGCFRVQTAEQFPTFTFQTWTRLIVPAKICRISPASPQRHVTYDKDTTCLGAYRINRVWSIKWIW